MLPQKIGKKENFTDMVSQMSNSKFPSSEFAFNKDITIL